MTSRDTIRREQTLYAAKKTVIALGVSLGVLVLALLIFSNVVFLTIADRLIRTLGHVSGNPTQSEITAPSGESPRVVVKKSSGGVTTSSTAKKSTVQPNPLFKGPSEVPHIKGRSAPPPNY